MVNKCCVSGCKSNYEVRTKAFKESKTKPLHVTTFTFPRDKTLRAAWIRKIPNKNLKVTNNSRVCIKHFHPKDVITEEVFPAHDGHPEVTVSTLLMFDNTGEQFSVVWI